MTETLPLKLSPESPTQRIIVGLSWDMRELKKFELPKPEFVHHNGLAYTYVSGLENAIHAIRYRLFYKKHMNPKDDLNVRNAEFEQFDLDLECYIFDEDGQMIEKISPDYTEMHNDNASVFHHGEDYTGIGPLDDEDISFKMNALPDNYHHLLFVVRSDCQFNMDEISNAQIRIFDAYTNEETLVKKIKSEIAEKSLYVFAHLHRNNNQWMATPVDHYGDYDDDMADFFKNIILAHNGK
jgi:stress response protein SCP2